MKIQKRKKIIIISILLLSIIMINIKSNANIDVKEYLQPVEYTEEFKEWINMPEEEKNKRIMPRVSKVKASNNKVQNPIFKMLKLSKANEINYSLKNVIPENVKIKNQMQTNSCWAFASMSSLETNLAMRDYNNKTNTKKVYDFSERHMDYTNSQSFLANKLNEKGYNRKVEDGGNVEIALSYLTNGLGAVEEADMPFENNMEAIDISKIQGKTAKTQVYDTIWFPDYQDLAGVEKEKLLNEIKTHIKTYGSITAYIHTGSTLGVSEEECYDNMTGAKYCTNKYIHFPNHAVSIIGWDDNYARTKFSNKMERPKSPGAWIIRNSWGEKVKIEKNEIKQIMFEGIKNPNWKTPEDITDEEAINFIKENLDKLPGYYIENNEVYYKVGDNGLMYVSYEDCNISKVMTGIIKASDDINYENIYQYDEFLTLPVLNVRAQEAYMANVFTKKTTGKEYINQIQINTATSARYSVYVNPNGSSKNPADLQLVEIKDSKDNIMNLNYGYHMVELKKPIEIKGNEFAIVVKAETDGYSIEVPLECKVKGEKILDNVKVEKNKSFVGISKGKDIIEWNDTGRISEIVEKIPNGDISIKAFTTSNNYDGSIKSLIIENPPAKTNYFVGENFDKTGMKVKVEYNRKNNPIVELSDSDYTIENGNNLSENQKSVTIKYKDKTVEQKITVTKKQITDIKFKSKATKTEYYEGENFDPNGIVIEVSYEDGTKKEITSKEFEIVDGKNLSKEKKVIVIKYEGKTLEQEIVVNPNPIVEITIKKEPNKTTYAPGENFDKTGMEIEAKYERGNTNIIEDYEIIDGENLKLEQTEVTIRYKEKEVKQPIKVEEIVLTGIEIEKLPNKVEYIQDKEDLDLTGGKIKLKYSNGTEESIDMTSENIKVSGFDNSKVGNVTITVQYEDKETNFDIKIVKEEIKNEETLEEEKAKNSNFDNATMKLKGMKIKHDDKNPNGNYSILDMIVENIEKASGNDMMEYYICITNKDDSKNIDESKWVKIDSQIDEKGNLGFELDVLNSKIDLEVFMSEHIYLYVKEVAKKGTNQSVLISKGFEFPNNDETIPDNNSNEQIQGEKDDASSQHELLPFAGHGGTIVMILAVAIIAIISYNRYKNLKRYIK